MIRTAVRKPMFFAKGDGYTPHEIGSYVAVRDLPWNTIGHALAGSTRGKGKEVDSLLTAADALELADLNIHVEKWATKDADGNDIPKLFVTGYDDPDPEVGRIYFAPVSDKYKVAQPVDALTFFDDVIFARKGAHYSAVWNMREKSMMGVTIEFPEEIVVDPGGAEDRIGLHGLGINSFDGSTGLGFYLATTRWACMNQLSATLRNAPRSISFKHTAGVTARVAEARELLDVTVRYSEEFDRMANDLYTKAMTDRQFERLVKSIDGPNGFGLDGSETDLVKARVMDRRDGVMANWRADHNANITGTQWGAYNVLSEYAEWGRKVNGSPRTGTTATRQRAIGTLVNWPTAFRYRVLERLGAVN